MARISQVYNKAELFKQKTRQRHINTFIKFMQIIQTIVVCYLLYKSF